MKALLQRALCFSVVVPLFAQSFRLQAVHETSIPFQVDGNSPSLWIDGRYLYFTSDARPTVASGENQFRLGRPLRIAVDRQDHVPMWIESVWQDEDGTIYGWYHNEPANVCPGGKLTVPRIGAAVSRDHGYSFQDLGLILTSGDPVDCSARNGFFAGGHGDFSVVLDLNREFFYFLFTNYGGAADGQGIATARLAFEDRADPVGRVMKYRSGEWSEPGLGGRTTPVFRARSPWQRADYDSYWGPAIHWNTHIERYVLVMNRACCGFEWPQEGIYLSISADLSRPEEWAAPIKIIQRVPWGPGFYPQIIGTGSAETDSVVGQTGRLYVHGRSRWEIVFIRPDELPPVIWPEDSQPDGSEERPAPDSPARTDATPPGLAEKIKN